MISATLKTKTTARNHNKADKLFFAFGSVRICKGQQIDHRRLTRRRWSDGQAKIEAFGGTQASDPRGIRYLFLFLFSYSVFKFVFMTFFAFLLNADTMFDCPFCNHEKSCEVKMEKSKNTGRIQCTVCNEDFQVRTHKKPSSIEVRFSR